MVVRTLYMSDRRLGIGIYHVRQFWAGYENLRQTSFRCLLKTHLFVFTAALGVLSDNALYKSTPLFASFIWSCSWRMLLLMFAMCNIYSRLFSVVPCCWRNYAFWWWYEFRLIQPLSDLPECLCCVCVLVYVSIDCTAPCDIIILFIVFKS